MRTLVCIILYLSLTFPTSGWGESERMSTVGSSAIENCAGEKARNTKYARMLFPINVAPDIVANTVAMLFHPLFASLRGKPISNIWPIVIVLGPLFGPPCGVVDAWHGYAFWEPVALDEHRKY